MNFQKSLSSILCVLGALCGFTIAAAKPHLDQTARLPNFVLIMTDDQGHGDIGSHGNRFLRTPHLDQLAADGARFDRFFVDPVCAPTRASLLSGRYAIRTGVFGVTRGLENMRGEEVTIAELLRKNGYATGAFGKWHNGAHYPYHPNAQGFDEFVGFCGGHWNDYFDPALEHNGDPIQAEGYIADILTDRALTFIEANRDGPFFCYVPYNTPHTPWSVTNEYWARYSEHPELSNEEKCAYAMCENIDHNVGRILARLDALELAEKTVVFFLTDNGPNGKRYNSGMSGSKGSVHEGGVRVPLFVRWTGVIEPGTVIEPNVAHIDLLPTIASLAGIRKPKTLPLDGIDVSPLLLRDAVFEMPERVLFTYRSPTKGSVRSDRYRATTTSLHDLVDDPGQENNLIKEKPDLHRKLMLRYHQWLAGVLGGEGIQQQPIEIGHKKWPRITLKAHEADLYPGATEGIDYCGPNGFANQWIQDWTDPMAFASWPVDVIAGGDYRVTVRYACPENAVDSEFRLEIAGERLPVKMTEAQVSEPWPAEQRGEARHAYISRDWKDLAVGRINLVPGPTRLVLRPTRKTGDAMPDIKAVVFERVE